MKIKFNNFLNEEFSMLSNKKLRDAIHEIITGLDMNQTINIEELSNRLLLEYRITISPRFLDEYFEDLLKMKKGERISDTLFNVQDLRWLGVSEKDDMKEFKNNLYHQKPSLAKHKERMTKDLIDKKIDDAYKSGMKDLKLSEETIKGTFVLQEPSDSKRIITSIYNAVNIQMRYKNTPENCWRMMIIMGNKMRLDTKRNYFDLAPKSIKKEYEDFGKINMTLDKEDVRKPFSSPTIGEDDVKDLPLKDINVKNYSDKISLTRTNDIDNLNYIVVKNLDNNKIFKAYPTDLPDDISDMNLTLDGFGFANLFTLKLACSRYYINGTDIFVYWDDITSGWYYSEKFKETKNSSSFSSIRNSGDDNKVEEKDDVTSLKVGDIVNCATILYGTPTTLKMKLTTKPTRKFFVTIRSDKIDYMAMGTGCDTGHIQGYYLFHLKDDEKSINGNRWCTSSYLY